jgi:penicillin-binding protein 2
VYRDYVQFKAFSRRAILLGGAQLGLAAALVGRLYYLQVLEAARYKKLSEENRISLRLIPPPRGVIVDRLGNPMAVNKQNYRVIIVAEQTPDLDQTLDSLSQIIEISDYDRKRTMKEVSRKRPFLPVTVRENLTWEEVARVEVNTPDLPGVTIDVGQSREYVIGASAAHVVGYVAAVAESDLGDDPLLEIPGFRVGKNGIEKIYDLALRGKAGTSEVEVNSIGRVIRELSRDEGKPGAEMVLTLDRELQQFAVDRLGQESGAVAVVDIHSGEVMVLASTPGFDPAAFAQGMTEDYWRQLTSDPKGPLTNKAIAGQYAPGSTFKTMVALAALDSGVVTPDHRVFCTGEVVLGDSHFHCWKKGGHGSVDMHEGIMKSCDVYFYDVARRVGIDRIAEMARRFGLGKIVGIDLPGEKTGLIPDSDWKLGVTGVAWQPGETLVAGIGQGYMLATPLQLAVMAARLANGGNAVVPHLSRDLVDRNGVRLREKPSFQPIGVSAEALKTVIGGMVAVCNDQHGTAYGSRIPDAGFQMAGKTGTSQVRRISRAERLAGVKKNEDLPWEERDHALFISFAPIDAPRFACAVIVEHGGGGSKAAAPIARDVLLQTQKRYAGGTVAGSAKPGQET